jgi:septal ring factor EnvC (AmiA/AmiB activator)
MTPSIKPWLSQQEAQRLLCELADANLEAAQRKRERDILQHALDEATARIAELEAVIRMRPAALAAEREACAAIADTYTVGGIQKKTAAIIATTIRARPAP